MNLVNGDYYQAKYEFWVNALNSIIRVDAGDEVRIVSIDYTRDIVNFVTSAVKGAHQCTITIPNFIKSFESQKPTSFTTSVAEALAQGRQGFWSMEWDNSPPQTKKKCECGAHTVGGDKHSSWCQLWEKMTS